MWCTRSCSSRVELLLPPGFYALSFLPWNFFKQGDCSWFSPLESFTAVRFGLEHPLLSVFFLHAQNPSVLQLHFPGLSSPRAVWLGSTLKGYLVPFGNPIGEVQGWEPNATLFCAALSLSRGALPRGQVHLLPDGGPGSLLLHPWIQQALLRVLWEEILLQHWLNPCLQHSPGNHRSQPHSGALPLPHCPGSGGACWGPHSGTWGIQQWCFSRRAASPKGARKGPGGQVTCSGPPHCEAGKAFLPLPSHSLHLFPLPQLPAVVFRGGTARFGSDLTPHPEIPGETAHFPWSCLPFQPCHGVF